MQRQIMAFLNAFTHGISGGDLRFMEIAKRIFPQNTLVVTSFLGKEKCMEKGLKADYVLMTSELVSANVILTYAKRVVKALRLLKIIGRRNVILYATSDFFPDVIPSFMLKLINKRNKWIQLVHHMIPNPLSRKGSYVKNCISFFSQKISLILLKYWADRIIAIGPIMFSKLISMGIKKEKLIMGYNGLCLKEIEEVKLNENTLYYDAVFLGRIHPTKGMDDLLSVWKLLKERNAKARYTLGIIGKGRDDYINDLKSRILSYGLKDKIFLLGYIKDAYSYLKKAKIFIFPSYEEGWGISICEALACKLPVVAYDLPVYKHIFDDGIRVVKKGDVCALSDIVLKMLSHDDFRRETIEKGYKIVVNYDWDKIADEEKKIIYEKY